jgi:hypothetical protein
MSLTALKFFHHRKVPGARTPYRRFLGRHDADDQHVLWDLGFDVLQR